MSYRLVYKKGVDKTLARLPKSDYIRVSEKILSLADDPRPLGCKKLIGSLNEYRIRVGNYRVIYTVADESITVFVIKIAHRKEVYR